MAAEAYLVEKTAVTLLAGRQERPEAGVAEPVAKAESRFAKIQDQEEEVEEVSVKAAETETVEETAAATDLSAAGAAGDAGTPG